MYPTNYVMVIIKLSSHRRTGMEVDGSFKEVNLFRLFLILLFHINRCFSCVKFLF
jgi:hypothetical protein